MGSFSRGGTGAGSHGIGSAKDGGVAGRRRQSTPSSTSMVLHWEPGSAHGAIITNYEVHIPSIDGRRVLRSLSRRHWNTPWQKPFCNMASPLWRSLRDCR